MTRQPVIMDPKLRKQKIFNPKYTFDNFVVGNSNKYAQAAALALSLIHISAAGSRCAACWK